MILLKKLSTLIIVSTLLITSHEATMGESKNTRLRYTRTQNTKQYPHKRRQGKTYKKPLKKQPPTKKITPPTSSLHKFAVPPQQFSTPEEKFNELVNNSNNFASSIQQFPTTDNRIATIAGNNENKQARILYHAQHSYPLIDEKVDAFLSEFLQYKKKFGSDIEQPFYSAMTKPQFITRLLKNRPLTFYLDSDAYLLRNGQTGAGQFETIGTPEEQNPLVLQDYLSYDEMGLAALLGISCPTYFINDGNRSNCGQKDISNLYEPEGIYAGLVGARFEKPELMEWKHMIVTKKQNTTQNGYGLNHICNEECNHGLLSLWSQLYGKFPTFQEAEKNTNRYHFIADKDMFLDKEIYKKRMNYVLKPFLFDANKRGFDQNKKIYAHIVGLGLGVWQVADTIQAQCIYDACMDIIKNNNLSHISDINFSWFPQIQYSSVQNDCNKWVCKDKKNNNITIHMSTRNPADKLENEDQGKLLVAMYAWDGNAFPGNEYWVGALTASGDPAAACCSTISELQNLYINPYIEENIKKRTTKK